MSCRRRRCARLMCTKDHLPSAYVPQRGSRNPTIVAAQAANELLEIKGIKASIVMSRYNSTIYLSARSIDEINVQVLMEKLGGGGHRTIAGAQLPGASVEEANDHGRAA